MLGFTKLPVLVQLVHAHVYTCRFVHIYIDDHTCVCVYIYIYIQNEIYIYMSIYKNHVKVKNYNKNTISHSLSANS